MKDIVLDLSRINPVPTRPIESIDGIAIHHSGDEGTPQGWARYHTTAPDQGGPSWGPANTIGYHVAILRSGEALKTALDIDRTPGVANHNWHLIHICLQGNMQQRPPTKAQIEQMLVVCRRYMGAYYTTITIDRVRTHGEWADPGWGTACPGIADLGKHIRFMLKVGY